MTLSSKLILLAIACMYFSLVRNKLKTLHIGCLHLFVQFSKVYFIQLTTLKSYTRFNRLSSIFMSQRLFYNSKSSFVCQHFFKNIFQKKLSKSD